MNQRGGSRGARDGVLLLAISAVRDAHRSLAPQDEAGGSGIGLISWK